MKLKISKEVLICFVLLFPFVKPEYMVYILGPYQIYRAMRSLACLYLIFTLIKRNKKSNPIFKLTIVLESFLGIITVITRNDFLRAFDYMLECFCVVAIVDIYSSKITTLVKALMVHSELCVYLNLLTIIFLPNGFFTRNNVAYGASLEWFLGPQNYFIFWLLPALALAYWYGCCIKDGFRNRILVGAILLTALIKMSGTGRIGILIFFVVLYFSALKKLITPFRLLIIIGAAFVTIVLIRKFNYLEPIVVNLLGKDMTFSNRIGIWDNAIKRFIEQPVFGHGVVFSSDMPQYIGDLGFSFLWFGATHCHCHYLQILFQGGLVGMTIWLTMIVKIFRVSSVNWSSKFAHISIAVLVAYLAMGITEVLDYSFIFMIIPLAYCMSLVQNNSIIAEK